MEKLHFNKLSDFFLKLEEIEKNIFKNKNVLWFRGQSDWEWNLVPGIYRHYKEKITKELDKDIVDFRQFSKIESSMRFKFSNSYIFKKENEKALWRTYFYMQHYNVQTRLLDWTENPLIALFFAIMENPDSLGSLWILNPMALNKQSLENLIKKKNTSGSMIIFNDEIPKKDKIVFKDIRGFHINSEALSYKYFYLDFNENEKATPLALAPVRLDKRMEMQQSCFTIFGNKINGLLNNTFKENILAKIILTPQSKIFLKGELLKYGFSFTKVYPDLDGLGKEINHEYFTELAVMEKFRMVFWKKPNEIEKLQKNQTEILNKSRSIREELKKSSDFKENRIDDTFVPVEPFQIGNEIKLIIIGQDPTIKNEKTRSKIEYTLNLNKNGALKNYISDICKGLDLSFENVYATNLFKYFYTIPPAQTMHVLLAHLQPNLELVQSELSAFPNAKIITLGEPVLQLLTSDKNLVREYWNYNYKTKQSNGNYRICRAEENKLGRDFYPFPHQPSIRKEFYKNHLAKYISFVKNN